MLQKWIELIVIIYIEVYFCYVYNYFGIVWCW